MGRSIPSFRHLLQIEKLNWLSFKKKLPSKKDKQEFDKVFDNVRFYTSYLGKHQIYSHGIRSDGCYLP